VTLAGRSSAKTIGAGASAGGEHPAQLARAGVHQDDVAARRRLAGALEESAGRAAGVDELDR
jgi:hypothetical protein